MCLTKTWNLYFSSQVFKQWPHLPQKKSLIQGIRYLHISVCVFVCILANIFMILKSLLLQKKKMSYLIFVSLKKCICTVCILTGLGRKLTSACSRNKLACS